MNSKNALRRVLLGTVIVAFFALGIVWYVKGSAFPPIQNSANIQSNQVPSNNSTPSKEKRFTFYEVLPEGKDSTSGSQEKVNGKLPVPNAVHSELVFFQVGAFQSVQEAESQKARIALIGIESGIDVTDIPGKDRLFRVVVGPLTSAGEQTRVRDLLMQAGIPFIEKR